MNLGTFILTPGVTSGVKLYAPECFWSLTNEDKKNFGCGPGKAGDRFVPDTLYGLNVKPACMIHDYMYAEGRDCRDKWAADIVFLCNMNDIIEKKSNVVMKVLRRWRAMSYFAAVRDFGDGSFYKGKA